jgi:hypothetical protein
MKLQVIPKIIGYKDFFSQTSHTLSARHAPLTPFRHRERERKGQREKGGGRGGGQDEEVSSAHWWKRDGLGLPLRRAARERERWVWAARQWGREDKEEETSGGNEEMPTGRSL